MLRGVNKVILIGNLGKDPEIRYSASGNPVCNFRIATTDTWKDKQSGQKKERTEWHTIIVFNKLASIVQQYLKKGSRVYIEGRLQTRKWQAPNGQQRYITEIVASELHIIEFKVFSNSKVSNKKVSNKKVSNKKVSNKKVSNKKVSNKKVSNKKVSNKKVSNKKVNNRKVFENFDDELPF